MVSETRQLDGRLGTTDNGAVVRFTVSGSRWQERNAMKRWMGTLAILCIGRLSSCGREVSAGELVRPEQAARGVLQRVIPEVADAFVLEAIPPADGRDVFEVESADGKIIVRGSSGVAIASGANWYLKYVCHCHLSFNGDQLDIPRPLPVVTEKIRRVSPYQYRYCFNFCAFSYTLAWWDWEQWQRMIDWMALHGINMPLSVTGQEAVWQNVYRKLGLTDEQLADFFVGPGFLPFGWMGCLDGWGGPLPQSWIDSHAQLQQKIVARERRTGHDTRAAGFHRARAGCAARTVSRRPSSSSCRAGASFPARSSSIRPIRCSSRSARRSSRNRHACTAPIICMPPTRSSRCRRRATIRSFWPT